MLSWPLLKKEFRSTWLLFVLFTGILTVYVTVVISMFDPDLGSILAEFEKVMPELMSAFGMTGAANADMIHYAASYLFGFIMLLFPILYIIILSNRLIAKYVDSGSMAYLLASPNKRLKIAATQGVFLWGTTALLIALIAAIGAIYSQSAFPGEMEMKQYVLLHVGVLGLHTAISGIAFFASCVFNETKWSYAVSTGIPLAGFILQALADMGNQNENLKYATFFSLFSPDRLLAGETSAYWMVAVLYVAGIALYGLGTWIFTRRNLPL